MGSQRWSMPGGAFVPCHTGLARDLRIAELERLKAGLTACIGYRCLSIDRCELANPSDRAGLMGPGPRYWIG